MAKKNDALKKYHFWLLCGLVPLLVLISVMTVQSSVGSKIEEKKKSFDDAQKQIAGKQSAKPNKLIEQVEQQVKKVGDRKDELWKVNWERQKDMYVWPNSPLLKRYEQLDLRFGDPLPNKQDEFDEFKKSEVYFAQYSVAEVKDRSKLPPNAKGLADDIAPTQFKGGWKNVLRYVNAFDDRVLTSEQIWLMMEDLWVQRSLLEAIKSVNAQMAEFQRMKYEKDGLVVDDPAKGAQIQDPLRRRFRSRIWELDLEVVRKDNKQILTGRLTNHTDRLQLMGLNNTMIVKVWLEPGKDAQPFEFKIGGEFLPGAGAMKADGTTPANVLEIVQTDDHIIPASMNVSEIARVEQVFDSRTVPVRRIEAMAMGFTDSRHAGSALQMPKFKAYEAQAATGAAATDTGMGFGDMGGGFDSGGGAAPSGSGSGSGTGIAGKAGGGTVETTIEANRKRYIKLTENVRRMPIAVAVIVDQAYMQDVLLAFANSPLRFQLTQSNWARFRGAIEGVGGGGSSGGQDPGSMAISQAGGGGLGSDLNTGATGGAFRPIPKRPVRPIGKGMQPGGMGGTEGSMNNPYGRQSMSVSESQLTSGLVELSVYGLVSLYEKYAPPAVPTPEGTEPTDPTMEPTMMDPKMDPNGKKPADGVKKPADGVDKKPMDATKPADPKRKDDTEPETP